MIKPHVYSTTASEDYTQTSPIRFMCRCLGCQHLQFVFIHMSDTETLQPSTHCVTCDTSRLYLHTSGCILPGSIADTIQIQYIRIQPIRNISIQHHSDATFVDSDMQLRYFSDPLYLDPTYVRSSTPGYSSFRSSMIQISRPSCQG